MWFKLIFLRREPGKIGGGAIIFGSAAGVFSKGELYEQNTVHDNSDKRYHSLVG